MTAELGAHPRLLAWAPTSGGYGVGSPATLSYGAVDATPDGAVEAGPDLRWQHLGWHQIQQGGWDADTSSLRWTEVAEPGVAGREGSLELLAPGRLPELFRERIAATIAVERFFTLSGTRGVIVTARRDLGRNNTISWHTSLTGGLTWQTAGVREAAGRAVAELRSEYDID